MGTKNAQHVKNVDWHCLLFTAKIVFDAIYEWKSKRLEGFQKEKKHV